MPSRHIGIIRFMKYLCSSFLTKSLLAKIKIDQKQKKGFQILESWTKVSLSTEVLDHAAHQGIDRL